MNPLKQGLKQGKISDILVGIYNVKEVNPLKQGLKPLVVQDPFGYIVGLKKWIH